MTFYVFWPQHLKSKESRYPDEALDAISICLSGTDHIVLDVIPCQSQQRKVKDPYTIMATKPPGISVWTFKGGNDCCVIEFRVPNLKVLQFYSLEPIPLTSLEKYGNSKKGSIVSSCANQIYEHPRYQCHDSRLRESINLLNLFNTHRKSLMKRYPEFDTEPVNLRTRLGKRLKKDYKRLAIHKMLSTSSFYITMTISRIAYLVSNILNWPYMSLVNISVLAQQIDLRAQQICYFPIQFLLINEHYSITKSLPNFKGPSEALGQQKRILPCKYYPDYIRFYNTVWLILNDISFGMIIGALLHDYSTKISTNLQKVITLALYDFPKKITISLANNPLGIKLNGELAKFFSELFLWVIEFSNIFLVQPLTKVENLIYFVRFLSFAGCIFGGTFVLSIVVDYFAILTLHIYIFHRISSKLYHWQLMIMLSLFHLFRGKKRNLLRERTDNNYFQLDQLLMGTIFFIILVFLLPTIFMFYLFFTVLRMLTINVEIFLESVIALLNHFPLFALLLRLKDPMRIPGGITFNELDTNRFELKNKPLSISLMFKPFLILMDQMRDIYFSPKTLQQVICGLPFVTHRIKLYQILYSSLPDKPVDINIIRHKLRNNANIS